MEFSQKVSNIKGLGLVKTNKEKRNLKRGNFIRLPTFIYSALIVPYYLKLRINIQTFPSKVLFCKKSFVANQVNFLREY